MWGAGEMAKGMVNQIMRYTPGMEVAVIANRTVSKAFEAYEYTDTKAIECNDLASLQELVFILVVLLLPQMQNCYAKWKALDLAGGMHRNHPLCRQSGV